VLAEDGDEVVNGRDKHSRTALHLAAWSGHAGVVEELLRTQGVNVGACAKDDTCALHFACLKGHTEVARQLLAKGANVNAKTRKNVTPLMMAAQKGEQDLVDLLLKRKADPLVRSKKGESALDVAKTSVYDAIKEASTRAKENARKDGAGQGPQAGRRRRRGERRRPETREEEEESGPFITLGRRRVKTFADGPADFAHCSNRFQSSRTCCGPFGASLKWRR